MTDEDKVKAVTAKMYPLKLGDRVRVIDGRPDETVGVISQVWFDNSRVCVSHEDRGGVTYVSPMFVERL